MVAVPPPTDPPVLAPARNEGALGLGYYIPPGFREFVRNFRAFAGAIDPVQGIRRAMEASGRAFDSELPSEERKAAAVEAALETLAPVGMIGMGALAKQPIKATLMDVLTPTGAPASMTDEAVEAVSDPSRRAFMKGAAATGGIAALAPDLAMEAMNKVPAAVTKTAAKAVPVSAINAVAENLKFLRRENDKLRELKEETLDQIGPSKEANELNVDIFRNQDEMQNEVEDLFNMVLKPEDLKNATNDSLEELASFHYDVNDGYVDEIVSSTMETMDMQVGKMEPLIREAKARGLDKAKDKNGISMYPNVASLIDEFESFAKPENADIIQNLPPTVLKMTDDDSGKSTEQLIKELGERAFKSQYEFKKKQLEMETDLSPEEIDRIARINASRKGRNMAEGGVVSFAPYLR